MFGTQIPGCQECVYHSAIRFSMNLKNEIEITKAGISFFIFRFSIQIKFELRTRFLFFISQLMNRSWKTNSLFVFHVLSK